MDKWLNKLGDFWVGSDSSNKFTGLLRKDNNDYQLDCKLDKELMRLLHKESDTMLCGSIENTNFTLINCFEKGSSWTFGVPYCNVTFKPVGILVGHHYENNSILITELFSRISNLEAWVRCSSFNVNYLANVNEKVVVEYNDTPHINIVDKYSNIEF